MRRLPEGAGRQRLQLFQKRGAIHDHAVLVDVNGVGGQRVFPHFAIAGRDGIQQRLIFSAQQGRDLVCGVGGGGSLQREGECEGEEVQHGTIVFRSRSGALSHA